jgi:hypothetical protein
MSYCKMKNARRGRRKGQSLIEFVCAATLVIPITLLAMDSFLILYGMQLNEDTCREAARTAASGDPRLAFIRASQIVSKVSQQSPDTFSLTLEAIDTSVTKSQLQMKSPFGGEVTGSVDITTAVDVKPLMLGWFLGKDMRVHLEATEEVPTTYVLPNALETSQSQDQTLCNASQNQAVTLCNATLNWTHQ